MMQAVAQALRDNAGEILHANALDLAAVKANKVEAALVQRLKMTEAKIETLAAGIEQLAAMDEPIGKVLGRTELADGLNIRGSLGPGLPNAERGDGFDTGEGRMGGKAMVRGRLPTIDDHADHPPFFFTKKSEAHYFLRRTPITIPRGPK